MNEQWLGFDEFGLSYSAWLFHRFCHRGRGKRQCVFCHPELIG